MDGKEQPGGTSPRAEDDSTFCEGHLFTAGAPPSATLIKFTTETGCDHTPPNKKPTAPYMQIIPAPQPGQVDQPDQAAPQ